MRELEDDPAEPETEGDSSHKQGLARNAEDLQENSEIYGQSQEQNQGDEQDLELDVPRPLVLAAKPAPYERRKQDADDRDDRNVDGLLGESVMADEEPLDDLDEQPPATDEGGKGFDDMSLLELCEDRAEGRRHAILTPQSAPTRISPAP